MKTWKRVAFGLGFTLLLVLCWHVAVALNPTSLIPGPWAVVLGIWELLEKGLLLKYVVASLFRVTWGYSLAIILGIPFGLFLGSYRRAELVCNPFLQVLRPISPLAWIPIAILWWGVGDGSAIFLIFLASFFPITITAMNAVRNVQVVHIQAGRNFGLSERELLQQIIYPSVVPQLLTGMRITLGIAWLVVVAAEMIAVNSGLGFLIVDARNAGNRYDLVIAGMAMIGFIGLILDSLVQSLERKVS